MRSALEHFRSYLLSKRIVSEKWGIIPDYAVAKFAEDARRRVRRRTPCTSSARQQSRFGEI